MHTSQKVTPKTSNNEEKEQKATDSNAKTTLSQSKTNERKSLANTKQSEAIKMPSPARASDRLSKLEQFQKLGERFEFLKDKDRDLKNFVVSQDGTLAKISLSCTGSKVEISNSMIIEKVVKVCQSELDVLLAKTEAEVLSFNI